MVKKICRIIWAATLLTIGIDYAVYKALLHSADMITRKCRGLWLPILTIPTMILIVCCFTKIFLVMRRAERQMGRPADGSTRRNGRRFLKIAVLQLSAFVVCAAPLSVFNIVFVCIHMKQDVAAMVHLPLMVLVLLNPLVDPLFFFAVYRNKLRRSRRVREATRQ